MTSQIEDNENSSELENLSGVRRNEATDQEIDSTSIHLQELEPHLAIERRIAAAYELSKRLESFDKHTVLQVWRLAKDLTAENASIQARKAAFALLKASASHPGIQEDRGTLFQMIITPIDPSEASVQISALERLTKRGELIRPFEGELIDFLNVVLDKFFKAAQNARKAHSTKIADSVASNGSRSRPSGLGGHVSDELSRNRGDEIGRMRLDEERTLIGVIYFVVEVLHHHPESFQQRRLDLLIDRIASIANQTTSRKTLHGVFKILRALTSKVELPLVHLPRALLMLCSIYSISNSEFEVDISTSLSNLLLSRAQSYQLIDVLIGTNTDMGFSEPSTEASPLLKKLHQSVFTSPARSEGSFCIILKAYGQLFRDIRLDGARKSIFETCLKDACSLLYRERDLSLPLANCLVDLAALCGPDISNPTFDCVLDLFEAKSGLSAKEHTPEYRLSSEAADCLIKLFLRCHQESSFKTNRVYKLLLTVTEPSQPTTIRLSVMKLLARLRCNAEQAVEVVLIPDSLGLAEILCRTMTAASFQRSSLSQVNRDSTQEHSRPARQGRSSVVGSTSALRSRSAARSSNLKDQPTRPEPPLWMYNDWTKGLPEDPREGASQVVFSSLPTDDNAIVLNLASWLDIMISVLKDGSDWEIYSYILVHLPSQLSNRSLFFRFVGQLQILHNLIVDQLEKGTFTKPPRHTNMAAGDVALCLYHALTVLLPNHEHLGRRELDNLVRAFSLGINKWDRAGRCCIHALALCCHEIPEVIDRHIFAIIQKMAQRITQSDLAIDILEFLGGLARLPEACYNATAKLPDTRSNLTADDSLFFKTIFGICISYIRSIRDQRAKSSSDPHAQALSKSSRQSGNVGEVADKSEPRKDFPEYVYALAYQVIIFWFLAIDVSQRAEHVGWIAKELAWKDATGEEILEEQSQVILDLMHRTVFSDLGETEPAGDTSKSNDEPEKQLWLLGMSIVAIEVKANNSISEITKRQASGTTHATYCQNIAKLPEHHVSRRKPRISQQSQQDHEIFPSHTLLQLTSTLAPVPIPLQPIKLPNDDSVLRALRNFDRIDTVDGHKAGIIFIGDGQTEEAEILNNSKGTRAYDAFLSGIGTKVKLQDAKFNTQGLDRESNLDGRDTYAWRDRVTEMVFHVTTMMPTDHESDPQAINKKKHIGNDRVKIIFNNSGKPFKFDTFPSEMNEVNVVITPEAHAADGFVSTAKYGKRSSQRTVLDHASNTELFGYYRVEVLTSVEIPRLSVAAVPKLVSADALPGFVRQIALNASVFSQVWSELQGQGEYVSSWRGRLKVIKKLREKYGNTHTSANISYPMPSDDDAPAYQEGHYWTGRVTLGGLAESDQLSTGVDFTRWS